MLRIVPLLIAACIAAGPLHAAPDPAYQAAFVTFQKAAKDGDDKSVEAAAEQFGRLSAAQPADPVLLAYSGAATAMRANTTLLPWRKLAFADDGLAQLDKALALLAPEHDALLHQNVPATLEARFVAASTFLRLPGMFNRHARGAGLLDEVLKNPLLATAPPGFRAAVWLRAADEAAANKRTDEARQWLQQVAASGAPQAAIAQAKLKEIAP
ncbi:MAG TPA: hypothetical protein VF169_12925 [Albitalea sp.]|uniref:hypothetical protein n=1 Tax=Piscinibacter sp. TaxID=1903157 RepID=UPI002ED4BD0A